MGYVVKCVKANDYGRCQADIALRKVVTEICQNIE